MERKVSDFKGLILAGGNGTRLAPITTAVNKHFLPIYDKPMIYYPLSTLMLAGIRDITLICKKEDKNNYEKLLGDGARFGISINFTIQENPNGLPESFLLTTEFISNHSCVLILGDNIFVGPNLGRFLGETRIEKGARILAVPVRNPSDYGVVHLDNQNKIVSLEEKPQEPKSNLAIPGIYFFDQTVISRAERLEKSARGELEIIDLLKSYLDDNLLQVKVLERGSGWLDAGSVSSLFEASEYIRIMQERQGLLISSPEEIALNQGWITKKELEEQLRDRVESDYKKYLMQLVK
jgi:glucose-1-phosphate thymidylyltransferase